MSVSPSAVRINQNIQRTIESYGKQFQQGYLNIPRNQTFRTSSPIPQNNRFKGIYPSQVDFNDGFYQGALDLEKNPDGPGIFQADSGTFFICEWDQAVAHGQSLIVLPHGHLFYGYVRHNKLHGPGVFVYPSGVLLCGVWQSGLLDGQGQFLVFKNQAWISAEFKGGKLMRYRQEERVFMKDAIVYPSHFKVRKDHQNMIQDIEKGTVLKHLEQFQIETQRSSYSQIKCQRLDSTSCYIGFIINNTNTLTGLGTVIKDFQVPFFGHMENAQLSGQGRFFLGRESFYVGEFKRGAFSGFGCLVMDNKSWQGGRWHDNKVVIADLGSGVGHHTKWVDKYLKEVHQKSRKYVNKTINTYVIERAFENLLKYDEALYKIETFALSQEDQK